jgi:hypothetical protein
MWQDGKLSPTWFAGLAEAIQEWRELVKQQRAFDDLVSRSELDRTLAEAGLAAGQSPLVLRAHPRARILLAAMTRRMGVDPFHPAARDAMPDVERRCIRCDARRQCEAWLLTSSDDRDAPAFCPNARTFERLRRVRYGQTAR